jgi:hypothetical protein
MYFYFSQRKKFEDNLLYYKHLQYPKIKKIKKNFFTLFISALIAPKLTIPLEAIAALSNSGTKRFEKPHQSAK